MTSCGGHTRKVEQADHDRLEPDPTGSGIFQQEHASFIHLLAAPLADLLQQSACLSSTHEQKDLPPDIVGVVLKDAPVAAIDALNEDQGLELIQLPLDFLLVGGLLKVPSGCIVDGRCRTKAKLAASSGDVGLPCECLQDVNLGPCVP